MPIFVDFVGKDELRISMFNEVHIFYSLEGRLRQNKKTFPQSMKIRQENSGGSS